MPYTPFTWEDNKSDADAERLNHMESGIGTATTVGEEGKTKAENALSNAASNKTLAEEAKTKAESALGGNTSNKSLAEEAKAKAEAAQATANTAKTEAGEGKTKANEAKTKAEESKTKSEEAKTKAEEAKTKSTEAITNVATETTRAEGSETELGFKTSQLNTIDEELAARITVLEARINGSQGSAKPTVIASRVIGATHTPEALTVKGEVNPNGASTEYWVEYGETEQLGKISSKTSGLAGTASLPVSITLSAASPGSLTAALFYRIAAKNVNGETRGAISQPGSNFWAGLADWEGVPDIEKEGLANVERQLSEMAAIGVSWVRADFAWDKIQPTSETSFSWTNYDKFMELCKSHGFKVIGLIGYAPGWANGGKGRTFPPSSVPKFAAFCKTVAERYYAQGMTTFEIWNEANIVQFWGSGPEPETKYYEIIKAAYAALKEAEPSCTVVSSGLSPAGEEAGVQMKPEVFLKKLYEKHATELGKTKTEVATAKVGSTGLFDACGYHPYVDSTPGGSSGLGFNWEVMGEKSGSMRAVMEEWGDTAKSIYATEVGCNWKNLNASETPGREEAAARLKLAFEDWAGYSWGGASGAPLCWFTMWDPGVYGLVDGSFNPRPEYTAYKNTAKKITMRPTASYAATAITNISTAGFTGNAIVNPNGEETTLTWEYGTGTVSEKTKAATSKPTGYVGVNTSTVVTATLTAGSTYKYRLKAVNAIGTTTLLEGTFAVPTASGGETLLGEETIRAEEGHSSAGRAEAVGFTVLKAGTLKEIKFKTKKKSDTGTISSTRVAVIADSSGKPATSSVLAEGVKTATEEPAMAEEEKVVTIPLGSTLAVEVGEKLWLDVLPIGGRLYFHAAAITGGTQNWQSKEVITKCNEVTSWEGGEGRTQGPYSIWGVGTATSGSSTPVLKLASNTEEVEWNSIGAETSYEVRISKQPITIEGRIAAVITQSKGSNPQKFKPEKNHSYGTSPEVTIPPGSTAYIEVRVVGTTPWSNAIGVPIAAESEPSTATLKGIEMGGWGKTEELEDAAEAKINITRLNKPSRATIEEWENKGVKVIYLYAYDVGGTNSGGVKAINRTTWVADAIKQIKESKPKYFEALNEPAQGAFWGSEATSEANAKAYIELLKLLKEEIVAKIPSEERPKIIASLDGGKDGEKTWVEDMKKSWGNNTFLEYFDLGSCHPYGGTGERAKAKEGNRGNVEAIHTYIGGTKEMCITEVGFPTLHATGDSLQYTEAEAAANFASLLGWAKSLSWMKLVIIYGYRDGAETYEEGQKKGKTVNGYGQWKLSDAPKLAVAKIAAA